MEQNSNQTKIFENNENYLNFCKNIANEELFEKDFQLIYKIGVLYDLYTISSEEFKIKETIKESLDKEINENLNNWVIKRLLETAFIFANLNSDDYVSELFDDDKEKKIEEVDWLRNKSYRIAISVYYYWKYLKEEILEERKSNDEWFFDNNNIIYRLFTRLWILSKARDEKIDDIDIFSIDLQWKIEATNKEISNRFCITDKLKENFKNNEFEEKFWENFEWFKNDEIFFSDFQNWVMKNLELFKKTWWWTQWKSIAISAPTSAWKTFILKKYIIYKILENYLNNSNINIVFIVPSKALINELKADFIELFNEYKIKDKEICNIHTHISWDDFINDYKDKSNLFIFTQERLNFFYSSLEEKRYLKIDLLTVDEAHKVGYWYRWTLLSYIIWKIKKDNLNLQIVLLAPLLSKLNKFKKEFWLDILDEQFSNFWLVAKNEIIVSIEYIKNEKHYNIKYFLKISKEEIFLFENIYSLEEYLPKKFTTKGKMSVIPRFFSNWDNQSIIFRFWAETVIEQIKLLQDGIWNNKKTNKTKLSNYLDDILPKDFWLSNLLDDELSYHNWRLPISIKSAIESNFKDNKIKYLCANYTVLEWVNLPAKNIFISREEYRKEELNNLDIKNLIWRSWRLNFHLSWNIFFINFKDIEERKELLNENNTEKLENNITNILNDKEFDNNYKTKFDRFLEYIKPWSKNYMDVISYDKNLINEKKDFEYLLWYFVSNEIDKALNHKKLLNLENNNEWVFLNKDYFIDKISVYKNRKNTYVKDFYDKIWELIYENSDFKADKISTLREHILMLCNNELKIKNIDNNWEFDNNFLKIVQKNIFIDPRKQLNFYDLIISWKDWFLKYHMNDFNNNKLNIPKGLLQLLLINVKKYFINEYLHSIDLTYFSGDYYYKDKHEKYIFENNIFKLLNQWRNSISLNNILKHRKKENYFKVLDNINSEIQFNYLNAFSIYFEIANLWYKRYIDENEIEDYDETKHKLDPNFIYYMELWTFYPNLIYLISKWVSRESAIWLTWEKNSKWEIIREWIIKLFPLSNDMTEKEYFDLEKDRILSVLKEKKKDIINDELEKFIY